MCFIVSEDQDMRLTDSLQISRPVEMALVQRPQSVSSTVGSYSY